jgi:hypothetical protein
VVDAVSVADAPEPAVAGEERDREPAVDEPVVHEHVGEAEDRHPGAGADGDGRRGSVQIASNHDEGGSDRRVGGGEDVVGLEPASSLRVMRAVDAPERVVPHAIVEQARPGLHRRGDRQRDGAAEEDEPGRRHEGSP